MEKVTQRDISECVSGLREVAKTLHMGSQQETLGGFSPPSVPMTVQGLQANIAYLETTAKLLLNLISDKVVRVKSVSYSPDLSSR